MNYQIDYERGIVNRGNLYRLKKLMKRAVSGEKLVIGFIGGSITQGFASSSSETCYAYRVYSWWKEKFPNSEFVYVNAGIGGTSSQFGVARAESDLLSYNPDFVITEFSVNDLSTEHFMETYEGLIRKIYSSKTRPAMLIVHNVYYDNGANAQRVHSRVGRYYQIPCVSMQSTIYDAVLSGEILNRYITPDDLHPNDTGHELISKVITYFLDKVYRFVDDEEEENEYSQPFTENRYENSVRYRNMDIEPRLNGFVKDDTEQDNITDCFKCGWSAKEEGDSIEFKIEGSGFSMQYRRYANKKGPIAKVVIDGNEKDAVLLDATFDLDWGDNLELTTINESLEKTVHSVKLTIVDENDCDEPFYLVSVIANK